MTEDLVFIFGGVMDERSKVCLVEELAISASPLCHLGIKPLNTKNVIMPLIMDRISPTFVCRFIHLLWVHVYHTVFYLIDFSVLSCFVNKKQKLQLNSLSL
jgi:hypothetical protein